MLQNYNTTFVSTRQNCDMKKEILGGVYVLRDPKTEEIKYVGQTKNFERRKYEHASCSTVFGGSYGAWREALKNLGFKPIFEPWLVTDDRRLKNIIEGKLIKSYGKQLVNSAPAPHHFTKEEMSYKFPHLVRNQPIFTFSNE